MQDFSVIQLNDSTFDLVIDEDNKKFESVDGMETAFNFQLFLDKRSSSDDVASARSRQGWMGDLITKQNGYEVGSLMYLKYQARNTISDKNEMAAYAEDALKYFVAIDSAKEVTAEVNGDNIEGAIKISRDNVKRYSKLWRNTNELDT
jgi:phage gp46-like protein